MSDAIEPVKTETNGVAKEPVPVFRSRVLGDRLEKAAVVAVGDGDVSAAFQQGEQQFLYRGFVGLGNAIPPLQDPKFLCEVHENSSAVPQNVEAYKNNIDGHGYRLEPKFNFSNPDVDQQIELSMRFQRKKTGGFELGPKPPPEQLAAERVRIREQMDLEKLVADAFFANCSLESSFIELRRTMRVDLEVTGNAYWECLRNGFGELVQFNQIPSVTMKMTPTEAEPIKVTVEVQLSPLDREEIEVSKRFRKFVQEVEGKVVFFKEFGDPRTVSRKNGRVYPSAEALKNADPKDGPATEILHYKLYSPRSPYGLPRWHGNLLAAVGTRAAEEINYYYFDNKSVPPLAILVSGGRLSDDSADRITKFIQDEIRGRGNFHKVLVIEAEPANVGILEGAAGLRTRIQLQPLTNAQNKDALFQNYIKDNVDRIGMSFRLPRPLRGDVTAVNRATFEGSLRFAEMQVFEPERKAFDDMINRRVMPDLKVYLWVFRSKSPDTRDPKELSEIITSVVERGVLTPAEGRELIEDVFSRDFKRISEPWVDYPLRLSQVGLVPVTNTGAAPNAAKPMTAPGQTVNPSGSSKPGGPPTGTPGQAQPSTSGKPKNNTGGSYPTLASTVWGENPSTKRKSLKGEENDMSSALGHFERKGVLKDAERAIVNAVGRSMEEDRKKGSSEQAMSLAEQRRRGEVCLSILDVLVLQKGWGLKRATDHLYRYLRCELDGVPWSPDKRSVWIPDDDF